MEEHKKSLLLKPKGKLLMKKKSQSQRPTILTLIFHADIQDDGCIYDGFSSALSFVFFSTHAIKCFFFILCHAFLGPCGKISAHVHLLPLECSISLLCGCELARTPFCLRLGAEQYCWADSRKGGAGTHKAAVIQDQNEGFTPWHAAVTVSLADKPLSPEWLWETCSKLKHLICVR